MAKKLNGYTKWIIIGLMLVGWGIAWGTTQHKVSSLEKDICQKVETEVYNIELGYIKKELEKINGKLDVLTSRKPKSLALKTND